MLRKLKFYFIGLGFGLIILFFILNKKGAGCSGYLPNSRVRAETLSKNFQYTASFQSKMLRLKIDEKFLKDSILTKGSIDFDKSNAQKKPCPNYILFYPKKNSSYEITFTKCKKYAIFTGLKKIK